MPDHARIDPALTVNEIVHRHPGTLPVLAAAGIDTCCGGGDTLVVAARVAGADLGLLLGALHGAPAGAA